MATNYVAAADSNCKCAVACAPYAVCLSVCLSLDLYVCDCVRVAARRRRFYRPSISSLPSTAATALGFLDDRTKCFVHPASVYIMPFAPSRPSSLLADCEAAMCKQDFTATGRRLNGSCLTYYATFPLMHCMCVRQCRTNEKHLWAYLWFV